MAVLHIDCPTGLAGNMLLGALLDLGVPEAVVHGPLESLGLTGAYRLERQERRSHGLRGCHLAVEGLEPEPPHRHWRDLKQQLQAAPLVEPLRQSVLAVFSLLAEAEGAVHGHAPEQVHFHEVGAIDALVDVVGVCAALHHLAPTAVTCSLPPLGQGQVPTAHGLLPVPAPAVLEIARRRAVPVAAADGLPATELTTPTGLALAAVWVQRFGGAPALVPRALGVGLGSRTLDRPNLLRVLLADPLPAPLAVEAQPATASPDMASPATAPPSTAPPAIAPLAAAAGVWSEPLLVQQAQIDDASAEDLAVLAEALRQAGAVEVFSQAVLMKKGRLGTLVTALLPPERADVVRQVWWRQSPTLGVREQRQERWLLPRREGRVETPLGSVRIKQADRPDGGRLLKPELQDLQELAQRHDRPLPEVRAIVEAALVGWESAASAGCPPCPPC